MKLSICIVTYNHEPYITETLQSVLEQETNFEYEILVGEDESTDRTREIVQSFAEKYPDKIRLFLHKREDDPLPHHPGKWNFINNLKQARGEYIAILDGDDYWCDPLKLQKQVDFLDNHPESSICFTAAVSQFESEPQKESQIRKPLNLKEYYTIEDFLKLNPITTCTAVLRNYNWEELPGWFYTPFIWDWPLFVFCAQKGNIAYIDEVTSVYRIHASGMSSGRDEIGAYELALEGREAALPYLAPTHQAVLADAIYSIYRRIMRISWRDQDQERTRRYAKKCLELWKRADNKSNYNFLLFMYLSRYVPSVDKVLSPAIRFLKHLCDKEMMGQDQKEYSQLVIH